MSQADVDVRNVEFTERIANFGHLVDNVMEEADDGYEPGLHDVHACILQDDLDKLQDVCEAGVNLNEKFTPEVNPAHAGMTPLALASALNKPDLVELLLDYGSDVNQTFATLNTTSMMTSAFHGHVDVVRLLIERGADVKAIDLQCSTALGYCFGGTRNLEVVQMLLGQGVDVNQKNMLGMNSLLLVSGYGNDVLVRMILNANADPNATNDFGHTALHLAVVGKRDQIKRMKRLGSPEAAEADRSLNRRNLDKAMQEWARMHRQHVGVENEAALAKCGQLMMSVGQRLEEEAPPGGQTSDEDEQEALKRRIHAVYSHRQEKVAEAKEKKKPAISGLLTACGGGKAKSTAKTKKTTMAQPYVPDDDMKPNQQANDEVARLSEKCANILRLLLDAGCNVNRIEKTFGMTALDMAILNGDVESATILVSRGGDGDHLMKMFASSDLYQSIVSANRKEIKEQLTYDDDLDINQPFVRFNITHSHGQAAPGATDDHLADEGLTPLGLAVKNNDVETVKMLLKAGADLNAVGPGGRTPLGEATAQGNVKMVQFLLSQNADVEATSPGFKDATPITIAAITSQGRVLDILMKRSVKVDKVMDDGFSGLDKAMETRDDIIMDKMLNADLETNFIDKRGFFHVMAQQYQSKDRNVQAIVAAISDHVQEVNDRNDKEKVRQAQMMAAQRPAPPQHQPAQQARGPPQAREARPRQQQPQQQQQQQQPEHIPPAPTREPPQPPRPASQPEQDEVVIIRQDDMFGHQGQPDQQQQQQQQFIRVHGQPPISPRADEGPPPQHRQHQQQVTTITTTQIGQPQQQYVVQQEVEEDEEESSEEEEEEEESEDEADFETLQIRPPGQPQMQSSPQGQQFQQPQGQPDHFQGQPQQFQQPQVQPQQVHQPQDQHEYFEGQPQQLQRPQGQPQQFRQPQGQPDQLQGRPQQYQQPQGQPQEFQQPRGQPQQFQQPQGRPQEFQHSPPLNVEHQQNVTVQKVVTITTSQQQPQIIRQEGEQPPPLPSSGPPPLDEEEEEEETDTEYETDTDEDDQTQPPQQQHQSQLQQHFQQPAQQQFQPQVQQFQPQVQQFQPQAQQFQPQVQLSHQPGGPPPIPTTLPPDDEEEEESSEEEDEEDDELNVYDAPPPPVPAELTHAPQRVSIAQMEDIDDIDETSSEYEDSEEEEELHIKQQSPQHPVPQQRQAPPIQPKPQFVQQPQQFQPTQYQPQQRPQYQPPAQQQQQYRPQQQQQQQQQQPQYQQQQTTVRYQQPQVQVEYQTQYQEPQVFQQSYTVAAPQDVNENVNKQMITTTTVQGPTRVKRTVVKTTRRVQQQHVVMAPSDSVETEI